MLLELAIFHIFNTAVFMKDGCGCFDCFGEYSVSQGNNAGSEGIKILIHLLLDPNSCSLSVCACARKGSGVCYRAKPILL